MTVTWGDRPAVFIIDIPRHAVSGLLLHPHSHVPATHRGTISNHKQQHIMYIQTESSRDVGQCSTGNGHGTTVRVTIGVTDSLLII